MRQRMGIQAQDVQAGDRLTDDAEAWVIVETSHDGNKVYLEAKSMTIDEDGTFEDAETFIFHRHTVLTVYRQA